jgi:hypothetical protein
VLLPPKKFINFCRFLRQKGYVPDFLQQGSFYDLYEVPGLGSGVTTYTSLFPFFFKLRTSFGTGADDIQFIAKVDVDTPLIDWANDLSTDRIYSRWSSNLDTVCFHLSTFYPPTASSFQLPAPSFQLPGISC